MNRFRWSMIALIASVLLLRVAYALPSLALKPMDPGAITTPTVVDVPPTQVVVVRVSKALGAKDLDGIPVDTSADIRISFEPAIYSATSISQSYKLWDNHNVTEMQVCVSLDTPCQLSDTWIPFTPERAISIPVDWLGAREIWVVAQFRDSNGQPVLAITPYGDRQPSVGLQVSEKIIGVIDEATPIGQQPPVAQTAIAATRTAFPVQGAVEIAGGRNATGGLAGETIELHVAFTATSPYGKVTEMRVSDRGTTSCRSPGDLAGVPWEPFVPEKTYKTRLAINWMGWYITVQYRDEEGNLSPVYCDDISLEGHPPEPTPMLTPSPSTPAPAPCLSGLTAILLPGVLTPLLFIPYRLRAGRR